MEPLAPALVLPRVLHPVLGEALEQPQEHLPAAERPDRERIGRM